MSYVPGHSHDLFLSYARRESEWVDDFRARLDRRLYDRLGRKVDFWQDSKDLLVGENWAKNIHAVIDSAAAFMAVCSPTFIESTECQKECLAATGFRQRELFLTVVKTPSPNGEHDDFADEIQRIDFFSKDSAEFLPGSAEFDAALVKLVNNLVQKLQRLRNSKVAIYVAVAASDMAADRSKLSDQLEADGYNVKIVPRTLARRRLINEVEGAELSVFLLGGVWDEYVRDQIQAATEAGKPAVFWMHPILSEKPETEQADLIREIREGRGIPPGSQILGGSNVRTVIRELQNILKPKPEFAPLRVSEESKGKVCLMHDPGETAIARRIAGMIRERKMDVFEPDGSQPGSILQAVPRLIADVDGVLLYRGNAPQPDNWLFQSFPQIQFADQLYRTGRPALRTRTCLLANPSPFDQAPGVQVIPCGGDPTPETLQPFFDRMMQARPAHADA
jgi:hypothetical protein